MGIWRQPKPTVSWTKGVLEAAVDRARLDWQQARHLMELSEPDNRLDNAIYYLQLTEKRYMYLLSHVKREQAYQQA
ncbi:YaaL family protein [Brevibacillus ruminantium]|uniref:YaaL family protein n=1 Tax=Brevibacillus ruminantium TaxID=2950604 RepID=A0ABY4WG83_9BACL|nr:DUF2508 family protein [Brevibacillus ruminantium]USG65874.1 YaaL family protein [Brevibacillus ruminantium]